MTREESELTDEALRDEIELVASLVVAATSCSGRMQQEELDSLLGVSRPLATPCPSKQTATAAR